MSNPLVANRYARALFQLAKEKNVLEGVNNELQLVKEVYESTPSFIQFLIHPKVTNEQKREFIKKGFGENLSEMSLHTLFLLIDRKRIDSLIPMIGEYQRLAYEESGMAEAIVYSAKPLTDKQQEDISGAFSKKLGKSKLVVKNIVNSELLGGIKIRIGDHIYDGTVKAQLDRMKRQLTGTR
ncbi:F0F1 ATP synthase subunit delta [bacterium LRH843]|nr:F0F1 ATP synthase subunit delta [bacterium LRH843]